ncbi:helix-turn-helix domain-containing protein [Bradyrhizobium liaoningense]|uniref:helix-turn-helix domain-containing protein n=1 Tax=Bradyrhizobium liaoningense TaxID=43992 RepID=UPI001BA996A9|nr:helix-turn-helix domain-containing protein [Bradyrhizobium liaoningense]MBR1068616.1 helix-turn-helix domain-containing protein [Bradyrhizobium liaoningense]
MFVRTTDQRLRPNTLGDLGFTSAPHPMVKLSEFTYRKGKEIFGEKEPAEYVYQIKRGAVRSYKMLSDGRRQIGAFHLKDDIFGLENGANHRFTAEAVVQTTVYLMKRVSLQSMADTDAAISRNLLTMTTANLEHAENHMLLLGRKTAVERVTAFLIEMDRRTGSSNVSLPMSRRDIADYLGLSLETVSRAVSRLHCEGVLNFIGNTQREIVILDLSKLHSFDPQG